jgi:wobble nucleotide-excising tRNase
LHRILLHKRESPLQAVSLESPLQGTPRPDRAALIEAIEAVNAVIAKHNATTSEFQSEVEEACKKLEQCYVAEAFPEYRQLTDAVTAGESVQQEVIKTPQTLKTKIEAIEREIVEHRRPAEELNAELCS